MTRGGQNATPVELRILQGNPAKRPIPKTPRPPTQTPVEPSWDRLVPGDFEDVIRVRETASEEWNRIVPVLDRLGLLTALEAPLLADYAICWGRLVQCERALAEDGLLVEVTMLDKDGRPVRTSIARNPLSVTVKEYRSQLRAYAMEFGLGPASRSRIHVGGDQPEEDGGLYDS